MRVHDTFIGLFFLALGLAVFAYGFSLVPPRHLPYGPGFFPQIVGCVMALTGAILAIRSFPKLQRGRLASWPDWAGSPAGIARFLSFPLAIIFFYFAVEPVGFTLVAWIMLSLLFRMGGIATLRAIPAGLVAALVLTLLFASLLGVPVPWGVLTPVSGWFL